MIKRIDGNLDIKMPLDDANRINELLARDKAMPVAIGYQSEDYTSYKCPVCGGALIGMTEATHFCEKCGQRLDVDNTAL